MASKKVAKKAVRKAAKKTVKKAAMKAAKKAATKRPDNNNAPNARLIPQPGSITIRMYRIGHGDCFLLAYRDRAATSEPVYILIDCGFKRGSNAAKFIDTNPDDIVRSIAEATGGHLHAAVITHEHEDHVNAISQARFGGFTIDESWFAWTENPDDELANDLRRQYHDRLLELVSARNHLNAVGALDKVEELDELLSLSLGGGAQPFNYATDMTLLSADTDGIGNMSKAYNKQSMKVFKDLGKPDFLLPHTRPKVLKAAPELRAFVLGPPRNGEKLRDMDPETDGFPRFGLAADSGGVSLASALKAEYPSPFAARYAVPIPRDEQGKPATPVGPYRRFYRSHYGVGPTAPGSEADAVEDHADWRRIDTDWLGSATDLAIKMGDYINNTSLVLAFELGKGGKVLLFAADAQRGNWRSWTDGEFKDGSRKVTTRDLLRRTVLYKVGHHGSHNATLDGRDTDTYANLNWMGEGDAASEFTAMITAVRDWAQQPSVKWDHPLKSIKEALLKKASGRVFQTDTPFEKMSKTDHTPQAHWDAFLSRASGSKLYFDYTVEF